MRWWRSSEVLVAPLPLPGVWGGRGGLRSRSDRAVSYLSDLPLAMVEWADAHGSATGDYTLDEVARDFHKPVVYRNFGLLVQQDTHGITMAAEQTGEEVRGLSFIPAGMVVEIVLLGRPKRPRAPKPPAPPAPA